MPQHKNFNDNESQAACQVSQGYAGLPLTPGVDVCVSLPDDFSRSLDQYFPVSDE